jgi:hypothetical protein
MIILMVMMIIMMIIVMVMMIIRGDSLKVSNELNVLICWEYG